MRLIPDTDMSVTQCPAGAAERPASPALAYRRHPGLRLTILLDGSGPRGRLAAEIARLARSSGLPAVGMFRGVGGHVPDSGAYERATSRHPVMITIVGEPESVEDLMVGIAPLLRFGELTVEDVQIVAPEPDHRADLSTARRVDRTPAPDPELVPAGGRPS